MTPINCNHRCAVQVSRGRRGESAQCQLVNTICGEPVLIGRSICEQCLAAGGPPAAVPPPSRAVAEFAGTARRDADSVVLRSARASLAARLRDGRSEQQLRSAFGSRMDRAAAIAKLRELGMAPDYILQCLVEGVQNPGDLDAAGAATLAEIAGLFETPSRT